MIIERIFREILAVYLKSPHSKTLTACQQKSLWKFVEMFIVNKLVIIAMHDTFNISHDSWPSIISHGIPKENMHYSGRNYFIPQLIQTVSERIKATAAPTRHPKCKFLQ